jgi:PAS domain S-box-containing protein
MFGTTEEEFCRIGRKWTADPDDPRLAPALEERARTGKFKGELTYIRGDGTKFIGEVNSIMLPGDELHFAILRDITERKLVEQRIAHLASFPELNPNAIFETDLEARITYSNPEALRQFPTLAETGGKHPLLKDISTVVASLQGGREKSIVREVATDGRVLLRTTNYIPEFGVIRAYLVDITERKQAEGALRESEELLRSMGDNLPDSYVYQYTSQADGRPRFLYISAGVEKLHGVRASDVLRDANVLHSQIEPEQITAMMAAEANSLKTLADFEMELQIQHSNGQWRWIHVRSRPRRRTDGQLLWDGVATDITESKQAQEALRENEELLREMGRISQIGGWDFDASTGKGRWTEEVSFIHDLDPDAPINVEAGLSYYHGDSRPQIEMAVREAVENAKSYDLELEIVTAKGARKWVRTIGHPVVKDGKVVRVRGSLQNITERKRAQELLQESEAQLSLFIEHAPAALAMFNREMRYLRVSHRWLADYGLDNRDLRGLSHYDVFPEVTERWKEAHRRGLAGEVLHEDADRFDRVDGSVQWIQWEIRPWYDAEGGVGGILIFTEDITERKRAEVALQESEARLRKLIEMAPMPLSFVTNEGAFAFANERFIRAFGYTVEEIPTLSVWWARAYPDPHYRQWVIERWSAAVRQAAAENRDIAPVEYTVTCKSGEQRIMEISGIKLGEGILATFVDLTERKRAEDARRESEALYRRLFNSMDEGFCIIEMIFDSEDKPVDYRFLEINAAFERQTGMREAVGKRMRELAPSHEAYWFEIYGKIALTGEPAHFESEAKALNRYYEVRAYRVGKPELRQVAIVFSDISGRKSAEEALLATLEEKTALLKEVHHRVKNNLQIVSSLLNLQARSVKNPAALETLRDTQGRIRAMALLHETLYREGSPAGVNCAVYFNHLCAHLCRAFGQMAEQVRVTADIEPVELGLDFAIPCGLIVNELVSNSFKHAFPDGRRGEITVSLRTEAEGGIVLSVADDGIGLQSGEDYQQSGTLGTQLVTGLAKQIAAAMEVNSDHGTMVQISFVHTGKGRPAV